MGKVKKYLHFAVFLASVRGVDGFENFHLVDTPATL